MDATETTMQRSAIKKVRVRRASARMAKGALGAAIGGGAAAAVIIGFSENYGDGPLDAGIIGGFIALGVGDRIRSGSGNSRLQDDLQSGKTVMR